MMLEQQRQRSVNGDAILAILLKGMAAPPALQELTTMLLVLPHARSVQRINILQSLVQQVVLSVQVELKLSVQQHPIMTM